MPLSSKTFLLLALSLPVVLSAQEAAPAVESPAVEAPATGAATTEAATSELPSAAAAESARSNQEIRSEFDTLLRQHPPELTRILQLDPALLSNAEFLARYPELASFVAANPEVRRNPHYYLPPASVQRSHSVLSELLEIAMVSATFLLIALALSWILRTLIDQKRWNRLSRTQTEVHNKILDRFGTSEELLAYIKSPAGSRFLESAPIPLHADRPRPQSPPMPRILWSVQIGVVVGAAALGMLLVSLRFAGETGQALFALGAIGLCLGIGFVAAAAVSMILSQRLGLWQPGQEAAPLAPNRTDDGGLVG